MEYVPMPGECHPAYADMPWLKEWVEGRDRNPVPIPVPSSLSVSAWEEESSVAAALPVRTMTRKQCCGPAPYVGQRFAYVWNVGVDELGRCVAGETQIRYDPSDFYYA